MPETLLVPVVSTLPAPPVIKTCKCGREYDRRSWQELPCLGRCGDEEEMIEMRNCACKSTLAIVVEES